MKKSFVCLSAVSVAIVCLTGRAQLRWAPLYEPGCGGAIVSVAVSPHDPQHVASGGDMLGTAASFDGGESWKPGLGLPSYEMATPTFHPTRADELWIGSCMGPFVSRDGGRTWTAANDGLHVRRLTCVAFDPFDPERLVAGTSGGGFVTARWPKR